MPKILFFWRILIVYLFRFFYLEGGYQWVEIVQIFNNNVVLTTDQEKNEIGLCQVVLGLVNLSIFLALYFCALTYCTLKSLLPRG